MNMSAKHFSIIGKQTVVLPCQIVKLSFIKQVNIFTSDSSSMKTTPMSLININGVLEFTALPDVIEHFGKMPILILG